MARPPVIPELYTGEKSWDEWIDHFDSVAQVCGWDGANKLKWLRVRLTERAGTFFRRLPEETRADFDRATEALRRQFEPESKKELYRAELQARKKKRNEEWAIFGEDLKNLADKAYPALPLEARERFALNQYLSQLDNPQVAFSVKQTKPKTVDDAVRSTLEMESFLTPQSAPAAGISQITEETTEAVAATSANKDAMKLILERMERMETELKNTRQHPGVVPGGYGSPVAAVFPSSDRAPNQSQGWWRGRASRTNYGNCWNCGGEGHLSRACPSPRKPRPQQGNGPPPMR